MGIPTFLSDTRKATIALILAFAFVNALVYAGAVPKWRAPDEIGYYREVKAVAEEHAIPGYGSRSVTGHPPLYPMIAAPFYLLGSIWGENGSVMMLRALGAGLLVLTGYAAYRTAGEFYPDNDIVSFGSAALVTLNPQMAFIMASVNSDALLNAMYACFFWCCTVVAKRGWNLKRLGLLVVIFALGLATKERFVLALPMAFILLVLLLLVGVSEGHAAGSGRFRRAVGVALLMAAVAGSVAYGLTDDKLTGQLGGTVTTAVSVPFLRVTFYQFWGFFDYLVLPLTIGLYRLIALLCLIGIIGLVAWTVSMVRARGLSGTEVNRIVLAGFYAVSIIIVLLATAHYQTYGFGSQGRYLFVAAVPLFVLVSLGLSRLVPVDIRSRSTAVLVSAMYALNAVVLLNVLVPFYN